MSGNTIGPLSFGPFVPAPVTFLGNRAKTFEEAQRMYNDQLLKKWHWLLEGRPAPDGARPVWSALPERIALPMAQMFENQCMLGAQHSLMENTALTTVALPTKYSLPIIRQAYAGTVVAHIASIQPLSPYSGGTGKVFFMKLYRETGGDADMKVLDSEYSMGLEAGIPKKVRMTITSDTVTAVKRILGATWSTEVWEDARGALGLDVASEMVRAATGEIARELDYWSIMKMLEAATAGNTDWSATIGSGYKAYEWYRTLMHAVVDTGDLIYATTYRRVEWVIAAPNVVSFLRKAEEFVIEPAPGGPEVFLSGVERIGRVNKKWDLYESPMMPSGLALCSYYARSNVDTPFIVVPYIPLAAMPIVYAGYSDSTGVFTNTDEYTRNMRTRSTEYVATPKALGTVTVTPAA